MFKTDGGDYRAECSQEIIMIVTIFFYYIQCKEITGGARRFTGDLEKAIPKEYLEQ